MAHIFTFSDNLTDKMKTGIKKVFITKVLGGGGGEEEEGRRRRGGGGEEEEGRRRRRGGEEERRRGGEEERRGGRVKKGTEEYATYHYKVTHTLIKSNINPVETLEMRTQIVLRTVKTAVWIFESCPLSLFAL